MSINCYDVGDTVNMPAAFTDSDGAATDPAALVFKLLTPAGATVTYTYGTDSELVKDSTGNYHVDYLTSAGGRYHYRWEATGSGATAAEGEFMVADSRFS